MLAEPILANFITSFLLTDNSVSKPHSFHIKNNAEVEVFQAIVESYD